MRWLAKEFLLRIPVVGWCMALGNVVSIKRGDQYSVAQAMRRCGEWLDLGVPVMIFPEGTRSKTAEVLPFKDGAFRTPDLTIVSRSLRRV